MRNRREELLDIMADATRHKPRLELDRDISRIREIMTEWNFGPMTDREAILAVYSIVGDNIQTVEVSNA